MQVDIVEILKPLFDFLAYYFEIPIVLGGYTFTIGALFMWCILVVIMIGFVKGLAS